MNKATMWRAVAVTLFCLVALLAGETAQAQLAQNGTSTSAFNFTNAALTRTFAHTTPALANRLMIVAVHMNINNSSKFQKPLPTEVSSMARLTRTDRRLTEDSITGHQKKLP